MTPDSKLFEAFRPGAQLTRPSHWLGALVWCWSMTVIAADIKLSNEIYVHWVATALLFAFGFPVLLYAKCSLRSPLYFASAGMVIATLAATLNSPDLVYGLEQALKLGVILIGGLLLFSSDPYYAHVAFRAFIASVYLNSALVLLGFFGWDKAASQMSPGRWGTVLNFPGSLWRCGILVLGYAMMESIESRGRRGRSVLLLGLSLGLIMADGSRTGLLLVPFALVYCGYVLLCRRSITAVPKAIVTLLVVATAGGAWMLLGGDIATREEYGESGFTRIERLFTNYSRGGLSGGRDSDEARVAMLMDSLDAIALHPLLGGGIGTTRSETEGGPIVVHMSYLQIWSDLGILGFVSYLGLSCGWLLLARRALKRIRELGSSTDRALYYNALFLLFCCWRKNPMPRRCHLARGRRPWMN